MSEEEEFTKQDLIEEVLNELHEGNMKDVFYNTTEEEDKIVDSWIQEYLEKQPIHIPQDEEMFFRLVESIAKNLESKYRRKIVDFLVQRRKKKAEEIILKFIRRFEDSCIKKLHGLSEKEVLETEDFEDLAYQIIDEIYDKVS
jgi:hypothetical protein